jgi:hypothetical protein
MLKVVPAASVASAKPTTSGIPDDLLTQGNKLPILKPAFNFGEYLNFFDPSQAYDFYSYAAFTNVTVRVVKKTPPKADNKEKDIAADQDQVQENVAQSGGVFPGCQSLIIKYSPPRVVYLGQSMLMSTYRQVSYHFCFLVQY